MEMNSLKINVINVLQSINTAFVLQVIYFSDKYHTDKIMQASRKLLDMANIKYRLVILSPFMLAIGSVQAEVVYAWPLRYA